MANYNVGNIEVGVISKSSQALSELDKVKQKLEEIKAVKKKDADTTKLQKQSYKDIANSLGTLKNSISNIFNLGKLYVALNYIRRLANSLGQLTNYASDYAETLNKFQVSFRGMYEDNLKFVEDLSRAYGLSKLTLMEYTATFNNMLKALGGLEAKMSASISRTLTQMAIDYASLFNQSIEHTMQAFQSVLAGSVRPIRSASGFDVSETSIFAIYQELGGTKTMRQLNQLEKRLLRIIAIQRQMQQTGAVGDYQRTIENFSNQLRVFKEQIKEFGSTWGQIILYYLKPALQWINGLLIALNEIGKIITNDLKDEGVDLDKEFASLNGTIDDTTESIEELNKAVSQLGLDQLNVLGGGSSAIGSAGGVEDIIKNAVLTYTTNLSTFQMEAHKISQEILQWAGFTFDANGQLINVESTFENLKTKAKEFFSIFTISIGTIVGVDIMSKLIPAFKAIINIVQLLGNAIFAKIALIIGVIALIGVAIADIIKNNEEKSTHWFNTLKTLYGTTIQPAIESLKNALKSVMGILHDVYVNLIIPIGQLVGDLLVYTIIPALSTIFRVVAGLLEFLMPIIEFIIKLISPFLGIIVNFLDLIFKYIGQVVSGLMLGISVIMELLKMAINPIIDGLNWVIEKVNEVGKDAPNWLGGPFEISKIQKIEYTPMQDEFSSLDKFLGDTSSASYFESSDANNVAMTNALLQSNQQIVNAINNKNTTVNLNGKKVSEELFDDINDVSLRKGMV